MDATKLVQSNRDKLSPPGNFACYDTLPETWKFLGQHATVNLLPTDSYQNDGMSIHEYILSNVPYELISIKQQTECSDLIRIAGTPGISASRQLRLEQFTAKECQRLLVAGIITGPDTEYVSKISTGPDCTFQKCPDNIHTTQIKEIDKQRPNKARPFSNLINSFAWMSGIS
jgi:hypothetical protein